MRKRTLKIIIASILVFLIITNPGLKAFKEYAGIRQTSLNVKREYNFIIFSIYKYPDDNNTHASYYLGIAANFFLVDGDPVFPESTKVPYNDY